MKIIFNCLFLISINLLCNNVAFSQGEEDSLQLLLPFSKDEQRVDILNALSFSQNENDSSKKIDYAKQALSISNKLNYTKGLAQAHIAFGIVENNRQRYNLARTELLHGLFLALKSTDLATIGIAYEHLGNLYFSTTDYTKSLRYYSGALKIADQRFDIKNSANVTFEIGALYFELQDLNKATSYFLRSYKLFKKLKNELIAARIENKLAIIYQSKGYDLNALHHYMQCIEVFKKFASSSDISSVRNNIATIYLKREQPQKAVKILAEAYKMDDAVKDYKSATISATNLSYAFLQLRKFDSAIYYGITAFEIAKNNKFKKEYAFAAFALNSVCKLKGDNQKALFYKNEYEKINNELLVEKKLNLAKLQVKDEAEKKAEPIDLLKNEDAKLNEISGKQNAPFIQSNGSLYSVIGLLIVVVISLLFFIFISNKKRKKQFKSDSNQLGSINKLNSEIRTPLNSILGMSNLASHSKNIHELRQYLLGINQSGDDLLFVINNFNLYVQITTKNDKLISTQFEFTESLRLLFKSFEMQCKQKGILFNSALANDIPLIVNGDKIKLLAIIQNLLNNALKFSEKGEVKVDVKTIQISKTKVHKIQIKVSDEGKGIDKKVANENKFGIGLFIVKHFAEKMNGDFEIKNNETGCSAIVSFELKAITENIDPTEKKSAATNSSSKSTYRKQILLVESNLLNQKVLLQILRNHGYIVTTANNGKEALSCLRQYNFDVILMEIQTPIMDGFVATKHIRNDKEFECDSNLPIVAMSSSNDPLEMQRCFEFGFNEYFIKPINKEVLLKKLDALCTNYQLYLSETKGR